MDDRYTIILMKKFLIIFGLILIGVWIAVSNNGKNVSRTPTSQSQPAASRSQTPVSATSVSFVVVDEKVSDTPIKTQVEQHIVAQGIPSEAQVRAEITRRYEAAKSRRGFRHHSAPTNIYIYVYGTKEQADARKGVWIGMLAKSYSDTGTPRVIINEDRLAALSAPAQDKFGLSEAQRKELFREIAGAEDRAMSEATARYRNSDIMKQIDFERSLEDKYKADVMRKYGVTKEQAFKVTVEGVKKGWP